MRESCEDAMGVRVKKARKYQVRKIRDFEKIGAMWNDTRYRTTKGTVQRKVQYNTRLVIS